jgi:hypothetical protein
VPRARQVFDQALAAFVDLRFQNAGFDGKAGYRFPAQRHERSGRAFGKHESIALQAVKSALCSDHFTLPSGQTAHTEDCVGKPLPRASVACRSSTPNRSPRFHGTPHVALCDVCLFLK